MGQSTNLIKAEFLNFPKMGRIHPYFEQKWSIKSTTTHQIPQKTWSSVNLLETRVEVLNQYLSKFSDGNLAKVKSTSHNPKKTL